MEVATKIKIYKECNNFNEICNVSTTSNEIYEENCNQMKFTMESGSSK